MFILGLTLINWANVGVMMALLVSNMKSNTLLVTYGIINIFLLLYEAVQGLSEGIKKYLNF